MNLHDKRFYTEPSPDAWEYVAIPNKFRAAKIKASVDTAGVHVSLVAVHLNAKGKTDVLHIRGDNPQDLKERILKSFPDAVFTVANSEPEQDLKAQFRAEQKAALERRQREADAKQFDGLVVSEHRKIERTLTRAQQLEAANQSINLFVNDVAYSSPQWVAWFRQHVGFFAYPDNSSTNRDTLLKFCESRGQIVPRTEEIASAMNYLLAHGHFYMKPSYKRSERDEMAAVTLFVREQTASESFSPQQIAEATKKLRAALPVGIRPSEELIQLRAKQLGISDDLLEVILHGSEQVRADAKGQSTAELKSGLLAMRNAARGGARPRQENMQGY